MKILRVNELYRSTYFRAASNLEFSNKQPGRARRLRSHGEEKGLYKYFWTKDHLMDVYVGFSLESIDGGDQEEIYPKRVIKGLTFEDYQDRLDDNVFSIPFNIPNWYLCVNISIMDNGKVEIDLFDNDNKFANRRSVISLIKYLHKLYVYSDPNRMNRVIGQINDTTLSELTYEDVSLTNFWGFLNEFGYDWEKFRKSININKLWDYYE